MILRTMFPEAVGGYYIFPTHLLGIDITFSSINVSVLRASGFERFIVKEFTVPFENEQEEWFDCIDFALHEVKRQLGDLRVEFDYTILTIPRQYAFTRYAEIPFADASKVRLIAPGIIEQYLPIPLDQVAIEGVVVPSIDREVGFLLAVPKKVIEGVTKVLLKHEIYPDRTSLDAVELQQILPYMHEPDFSSATIVLLDASDSCARGMMFSGNNAPEYFSVIYPIRRADIDIREWFEEIADEFVITFDSYKYDMPDITMKRRTAVYITGKYGGTADFINAVRRRQHFDVVEPLLLATPKEEKNSEAELQNGKIHVPACTIPLAATLAGIEEKLLNIDRYTLHTFQKARIVQGMLVAWGLFAAIVGGLGAYSFITLRKLSKEVETVAKNRLRCLTECVPNIPAQPARKTSKRITLSATQQLEQKLRHAESATDEANAVWSLLSNSERFELLHYWQVLTLIDRDALSLDLRKMILRKVRGQKSVVILEGEVGSFESLADFETALRDTNLFETIPALQETKFSLTLTVAEETPRENN